MKKYMQVESHGYVWRVDAEKIADNRARYYADLDSDTIYEDEFQYTMEDDYELSDWFLNNMDYHDLKDHWVLIFEPEPLTEPDFDNCEYTTVEE